MKFILKFIKNNYLLLVGLFLFIFSITILTQAVNTYWSSPNMSYRVYNDYRIAEYSEAIELANGYNIAEAEHAKGMFLISGLMCISATGCFIGNAAINKKQ